VISIAELVVGIVLIAGFKLGSGVTADGLSGLRNVTYAGTVSGQALKCYTRYPYSLFYIFKMTRVRFV
jgi:hypothetical protein